MKTIFLFLILITSFITQAQTNTPNPQLQKADSLFHAGNMAAARTAYLSFIKDNQALPINLLRLGYASYKTGKYDEAIQYLQKGLDGNPAPQVLPVLQSRMAMAYGSKNDQAKALEWLEKAHQSSYINLYEMDNEPGFASIRKDAKFKEIYQDSYRAAYPCMSDSIARAFDFWVGEWEAFVTGTNVRAGWSVIERIAGGCGILENWTSYNNPFSGKSINYYDPATGKWQQVWVGSSNPGASIFESGEYKDGALRFTFKQPGQDGQEIIGNFIFYNLGPNQVRQYNDQSTDGGKTYQVVYDFTYIRKGTSK